MKDAVEERVRDAVEERVRDTVGERVRDTVGERVSKSQDGMRQKRKRIRLGKDWYKQTDNKRGIEG